jgi:ketosteroid isomerase-like protein
VSHENVEAVRQVLSGLSPDAAQERTVESFVERLSPDVEFVEDPRFPEAATYHGREEYLRYAREFVEQFDQFTFAVEGLREIPDGRVLVCLHLFGRGKGSNAVFDVRAGWVYTVRDGRVVHIRAYMDRDEALKAVGLRE